MDVRNESDMHVP